MILYPALDLKGGKVVRLRQGDLANQTIYSDDPAAVARRWIDMGAEWLHVVNLDGAFSLENNNEKVVESLVALGAPIQFGGGLRSFDDVKRAFDLGVARVVLGTLAVEQPDTVATIVDKWSPKSVAVALDARDGKVTTRGWQHTTDMSPVDLGKQMVAQGAEYALYTDVKRDGELTGVNVQATVELAKATGMKVIASGGVTSLGDIVALQESSSVDGAILGTALYEGLIDLAEALRLAREK